MSFNKMSTPNNASRNQKAGPKPAPVSGAKPAPAAQSGVKPTSKPQTGATKTKAAHKPM
jgi:hypothetical protein